MLEGLPYNDIQHGEFRPDGDYISNDWQENPNGEGYQRQIAAGSPNIQGRVADLRARVAAVNKTFEARYGWGQAQEDYATAAIAILSPEERIAARPDRGRDTAVPEKQVQEEAAEKE